jgi:hypothetical protein
MEEAHVILPSSGDAESGRATGTRTGEVGLASSLSGTNTPHPGGIMLDASEDLLNATAEVVMGGASSEDMNLNMNMEMGPVTVNVADLNAALLATSLSPFDLSTLALAQLSLVDNATASEVAAARDEDDLLAERYVEKV